MVRETFDRQLERIKNEILNMGNMVKAVMAKALLALEQQDEALARQVFADDQAINEKRYTIENAVVVLMATQQPLARDLRLMTSILEVSTELERMGDYAKGIGKVVLRFNGAAYPIRLDDLSVMAAQAISMLDRALAAFFHGDVQTARALPREDDIVDGLYARIYQQLVAVMIADPQLIDVANLLMWATHNIERLADRVTNICERTVFIVTGDLVEMDQMRSGDE